MTRTAIRAISRDSRRFVKGTASAVRAGSMRAFTADEIPTAPRGRRVAPKRTAWSLVAADELPTTLRRSAPPPLPRPRSRPSPPPLPLLRARPIPPSLPPPLPPIPKTVRGSLPSLASILEPCPWLPSRPVLVPPDPEAFVSPAMRAARRRSELRWVFRIVLLAVIVAGELVLADPSGALHPPRDFADATSMVIAAAHASITTL